MSGNTSLMEVLIKELRSAAEEEYQRIIKDAEEQARKIIEEAMVKAEDLRRQKINQLLVETRQKLEAELAPKRLEIRRKYLAERYNYISSFLDELLSQVVREIKSNEEYYHTFVLHRLEEAITSIKANKITVHPCLGDREIVQRIVKEEGELFSKVKPDLEINVGDEIKCNGGFIAVSNDGREYYNASLEAKIQEIRERLLPEILKKFLQG